MITTAPDSITKIPSLQGALINLRPVRPADIRAIARYANDPSVARWVPNLPHPYTSAHALQWVRLAKQLASDAAGYSFGIEHPDSGEIIGMIGLKDVDWTDRRAEVGYWLAKTMWRRGYMEEALGLAAELQGDGEEGLARRQVPVLVLQDDGHLVRVLGQQVDRTGHARGVGLEGDIEMVRARQAFRRRGPLQGGLDHAAQGLLGHGLVVHLVLGRRVLGHGVSEHSWPPA